MHLTAGGHPFRNAQNLRHYRGRVTQYTEQTVAMNLWQMLSRKPLTWGPMMFSNVTRERNARVLVQGRFWCGTVADVWTWEEPCRSGTRECLLVRAMAD